MSRPEGAVKKVPKKESTQTKIERLELGCSFFVMAEIKCVLDGNNSPKRLTQGTLYQIRYNIFRKFEIG